MTTHLVLSSFFVPDGTTPPADLVLSSFFVPHTAMATARAGQSTASHHTGHLENVDVRPTRRLNRPPPLVARLPCSVFASRQKGTPTVSHPVSDHQSTNHGDLDSLLDNLPLLLAVPRAAKILGISRASAYRLAAAGELPVRHLGGRIYVVTGHLRRLIEGSDEAAA